MGRESAITRYFESLGRATDEYWLSSGHRADTLTDAAERALRTVEVPPGLSAQSILQHTLVTGEFPPQAKADDFGQPPIIVYRSSGFFVQALIWMEGTTAVHDHKFCGAFRVVEGSSLHVTHSFAEAAVVGDRRLRCGRLASDCTEILRAGSLRRIEPGQGLIHALFHLEMPTVTIVVRNDDAGTTDTQYTYLPPGLAYDGLWTDRQWAKRLHALDSLRRLDPGSAWSSCVDLVKTLPSWEAFRLVFHMASVAGFEVTAQTLADPLIGQIPELSAVLIPALAGEDVIRKILLRRGLLTQPSHRLFLALLANLPDVDSTVSILGQLFPDSEPGELLLEWVTELSGPSLRGISGLNLPEGRLDLLRQRSGRARAAEILREVRHSWGDTRADPWQQLSA